MSSPTTRNLGFIQAIQAGLTAPTNIKMLWYNENTGINAPYYYDVISTTWMPLASTTGLSGDTNYIVKFTSNTTIGDSQLFDDGDNIGINTISPEAKLHIVGSSNLEADHSFLVRNSDSLTLMQIANNGYVGIGSDIDGNYTVKIQGTGDGLGALLVTDTTSFQGITLRKSGFGGGIVIDTTFAYTHYYISGGETMFIGATSLAENVISVNTKLTFMGLAAFSNSTIFYSNTGNWIFQSPSGSSPTPSARIHITGSDSTSSNFALRVEDSGGINSFSIRNDGRNIQRAVNSTINSADLNTSELSWYINESLNTIIVKVKYSDGTTVKMGTINLL